MSNYQRASQGVKKAQFELMSAPLSPIASNDDDETWINELLAKSAPITSSNSYSELTSLPAAYNNFDLTSVPQTSTNLDKYFDNESIFSNEFFSSSETSQVASPRVKAEPTDDRFMSDLYSVNDKLENFQKTGDFTPKSLETIFDTQDILKDSPETSNPQTIRRTKSHPQHATSSTSSVDQSCMITKASKRKNPRKRLTDTQKQAHNRIEKKYRISINAKIAGLQQLIPWVAFEKPAFETGKLDEKDASQVEGACTRLNKSMILEKATDYILYLQSNEQRILQENLELKREVLRLGGNINNA